jgi:LacI family transcriptional regulator
MTMHLIDLGHRRIGFIIGSPDHMASDQRHFGYRKALYRAGIAYEPALVRQGNFDFASGRDAAESLLALPAPPTAVFASNDDMAAGVLAYAHGIGLDIPADLSVAGFDDTALASLVWPPLTTIRQPVREMAYTAAELLLTQQDEVVHKRLDYELVVRASTASPRNA